MTSTARKVTQVRIPAWATPVQGGRAATTDRRKLAAPEEGAAQLQAAAKAQPDEEVLAVPPTECKRRASST